MTITLDSEHELLLLDDGSIKIFRNLRGSDERYVIALSRISVQRLLDNIAFAYIKFYESVEPEDLPLFDIVIRPVSKR